MARIQHTRRRQRKLWRARARARDLRARSRIIRAWVLPRAPARIMGVFLPPPVVEFSVASRAWRSRREAERSGDAFREPEVHFTFISRKRIVIEVNATVSRNAKERREKQRAHGEKMAPDGRIIRTQRERIVPYFLLFFFLFLFPSRKTEGDRSRGETGGTTGVMVTGKYNRRDLSEVNGEFTTINQAGQNFR